MSEKDSIAVQFLKTSTGDIHGITVEGVSYGILIDSGSVTLDSSNLYSPFKFQDGAGTGIASQRGATLTIRDCSFTGFGNAVQVNEYAPPGTANAEGAPSVG